MQISSQKHHNAVFNSKKRLYGFTDFHSNRFSGICFSIISSFLQLPSDKQLSFHEHPVKKFL